MSYINREYILKVEVKEDSDWSSYDADYVYAKMEAMKYELNKIVGDKFNIEVTTS